jgi:hypothetical protein
MEEPPFDDVSLFSPQFWKSLHPIAVPFLPVIRSALRQRPLEVLWAEWQADDHRGGHWLVRRNAEAARRGGPTFRRSDWDRLFAWVQHHPRLGWRGAMVGLLWFAVLGLPAEASPSEPASC